MKTLYDLRGIENRGKNMKRTITLRRREGKKKKKKKSFGSIIK